PPGTIYAIAQTQDGYLWLGTQSGLVRFDGVRFSPVIDNIWVRELERDRAGNFWIATADDGLFRMRGGALTRFSQAEGLPSDGIRCVVPGNGDDVWICTSRGLARMTNGRIAAVAAASGIPADNLRTGCRSSDGAIWFGGEGPRLSVWKDGRFTQYALQSMPPFAYVRAMLGAANGDVWIGTSSGLIRWRDGREQLLTTANGLPDNRVFSLMQSRDGSIWVGTDDGFARLRNGDIESFRSRDGLSQSAVYALFEDREGGVWAGTKNGLNQFLDGRSIPYTVSEGVPSDNTGPVLEDRRGVIWAGTLDAGLAHFDGRRFHALTVRNGLASNTVRVLSGDEDGSLWVGTSRGLSHLRGGRVVRTYTTADGLPSNDVRSLLRASGGGLWVGTAAGLAELNHGIISVPPGLPRHWPTLIRALAEGPHGRLFIATGDGSLEVLENGSLREFQHDGLPVRDVDAFFRDKDGFLWMGTLGGGLRLLRNGKLFSFYLHDGLFDNEIYGITADNDDELWMACSKGIFTVRRADLLKRADGLIPRFESKPYSPTDGLRTIECNADVQPSAATMSDGRMWFSTTHGLLALDVGRMLHRLTPPPIVIEDILVNGQSEPAANIAKLSPGGRKNLEFHYTGLSFVVPARIRFRYMLEGFDKGWIDAGTRREAFYTNLPAGNYRFRVTGCNVDGTCNETGTSVAFSLAPSFYQQRWFAPFCVLVAALGAWLAYQLRIRGLRAQFDLVLAERSRIARELHDTLIQGFSGITMTLQALSARLHRAEDREALLDIIRDAGDCLKDARLSVAGLRSPQGRDSGLAVAIAAAAKQMTETKDIRLKLKLEPNAGGFPADVEYNLLRIVQEAVTNSVKHSRA
ncbi:MAG TPA: two-component regulator propeller domain-containing protein, partial [Bryobacteraceae bacterium]|nr:two-component regulator propeller domain-containing protein [Bryobacteraceae bacterium]